MDSFCQLSINTLGFVSVTLLVCGYVLNSVCKVPLVGRIKLLNLVIPYAIAVHFHALLGLSLFACVSGYATQNNIVAFFLQSLIFVF